MKKLVLNTQELNFSQRYKLLIGSIVPRPIGFISSVSKNGIDNLAPFSFFNAVCSEPMTVLFCPVIRATDGKEKDTLSNIKETKEFVVNIVSEEIAAQMHQCSEDFPFDIDEFGISKLTKEPAEIVKPKLVEECKINMECILKQLVEIGNTPGGSTIVIGEVIRFHIKEEIYDNGKILISKLKPVGRLGGNEYCYVNNIFKL